MKSPRGFCTRLLAAAVLAGAFGCTTKPVRFETPKEPIKTASGRIVEARACGFHLLLFFPIAVNSRAVRAFEELEYRAINDVLTDIRVSESWFYGLVGTGYCTKLSAIAYPQG